jgi:competence protein ComEC
LEGTLREDASVTPYGASFAMVVERVDAMGTAGGVRLSIGGSLAAAASGQWRRGRRVRVVALLRFPTAYRNPGASDEIRSLARRGVCLVGSVKSAALVEVIAHGTPVEEAASGARAWVRRTLATTLSSTSERSSAITTSILIGDRTQLKEEDERRLQEAGTYHVIAISGGNIAIAAALLLLAGRALLLGPSGAAALTIAALLFYGQITGPAPSVNRAVTAAVIFLAARIADLRGPPINALAVAAILAVAWSPEATLDPGFILSFGGTLGILLGTPLVIGRHQRLRGSVLRRGLSRLRHACLAVLAATICAEIALAPVSAFLFRRVTGAGLLLNFAAIPLMTFVQLGGAALLAVTGAWSSLSRWLIWVPHISATGLVESARLVEIAPWLSRAVSPPAWPILGLYYVALAGMLSARLRKWALAVTAATGAVILLGPTAGTGRGVSPSRDPLRVVVLDVGQGDATFLSMGGHAFLVDAGGVATFSAPADDDDAGFDVGERVVVPALRAMDVGRLHALVITHGDPDHILGAPAVLRAFAPRNVWEGVPVPPHAGLQALRHLAIQAGAVWRTVQAGDREWFQNVELRVLHPPPPEWERQRIRNEDSIVVEARLGDVSIVLAGDIGREGEHAILSRLEPGRLTVLKAGHHGSATSSTPELLASLAPAAVIFSAGRDNRFGHPHPAVVARFDAMGTAIFRTDHDGAVFVETDGTTVKMRGWTGRAALLTTSAARTTNVRPPAAGAAAHTTTRRRDVTKE